MYALVAMARLLFPLGELIIGIIVDTTVLALGIFIIVTACIGLLRGLAFASLLWTSQQPNPSPPGSPSCRLSSNKVSITKRRTLAVGSAMWSRCTTVRQGTSTLPASAFATLPLLPVGHRGGSRSRRDGAVSRRGREDKTSFLIGAIRDQGDRAAQGVGVNTRPAAHVCCAPQVPSTNLSSMNPTRR
jgi:hypothetical protein